MENPSVDVIIENLFHVLPIIHKKLLQLELETINRDLSRLHLAIMRTLGEDKLPISEIARQLLIPKPQMTLLINQLTKMNIVKRQPDDNDRRVTNIALTDTGKKTLKRCRELVRVNIKQRLSSLDESELQELAASLQKIRKIGTKFE